MCFWRVYIFLKPKKVCRFTEALVVFVLETFKFREVGDQNVLVFKTWPKRARWLLDSLKVVAIFWLHGKKTSKIKLKAEVRNRAQ